MLEGSRSKQEERYLCCGISHVFQGLRGHFVDVTLHSAMPRRYLLIFFFSEILFFNVIEIICYAPYFKGLVRDIFNPNFGKT